MQAGLLRRHAVAAMVEHICERFGWNVIIPKYGQTVDLG